MFARALGIDPGLVRTGWAVIEKQGSAGRPTVLGYGLIAPPTDAELPQRLAFGAQQLRVVVAEYRPDFVALEEIFTAPRHPRSALLMAHMRGAICLLLADAGVPIRPLTATTVKQRLTSSGHASKEQVQRMVLRLTGLEPRKGMKLDETDAMALALAGLHQDLAPPSTLSSTSTTASVPERRVGRSDAAVRRHVEALLSERSGRV
jgi:crossover junction endodeoxyribonuclease RuvC